MTDFQTFGSCVITSHCQYDYYDYDQSGLTLVKQKKVHSIATTFEFWDTLKVLVISMIWLIVDNINIMLQVNTSKSCKY